MPRIGELNRRIALQTVSYTPAGGVDLTPVYATVANLWAQAVTLKGAARIDGVNAGEGPTHRFVIRRRTDVSAKNFILYASRRFKVLGVENVDEQNRWQDLLCEEMRDA